MTDDAKRLFLRRCDELLHALATDLRTDEVAGVRALVEDGDYADGIRTLAWIIDARPVAVSESTWRRIGELSHGVVDMVFDVEGSSAASIQTQSPGQDARATPDRAETQASA